MNSIRVSHPALVQKLIDSFYVDDVVTGASTEEEAFQLFTDSKRILRDGVFSLRKFKTNSQPLQLRINTAENRQGTRDTSFEETHTQAILGEPHCLGSPILKVLGVYWDTQVDKLNLCVSEVAKVARTMEPTKRNMVSIVGRFYNPLG